VEEGRRGSAHVELVARGYVDLRVRAEDERLRAGREERGRNSNKGRGDEKENAPERDSDGSDVVGVMRESVKVVKREEAVNSWGMWM
jgi:hypothetical protein